MERGRESLVAHAIELRAFREPAKHERVKGGPHRPGEGGAGRVERERAGDEALHHHDLVGLAVIGEDEPLRPGANGEVGLDLQDGCRRGASGLQDDFIHPERHGHGLDLEPVKPGAQVMAVARVIGREAVGEIVALGGGEAAARFGFEERIGDVAGEFDFERHRLGPIGERGAEGQRFAAVGDEIDAVHFPTRPPLVPRPRPRKLSLPRSRTRTSRRTSRKGGSSAEMAAAGVNQVDDVVVALAIL